MMALTQAQLTNVIGYIDFKLSYIYNMRNIALNPNSSPSDVTTSNQNALSALDDLQTLLNTIYTNLGRTKPTSTYTLQQLTSMGLT